MNTDAIGFLGSLPYLVRRVVEVRRILEDFSADIPRRLPILTEAYGKMLFKCPIISCTRFYRGFENPEQRDKHLRQHERAYKCMHDGCDYRELGFATEVELRRHVELCHNALPEEPTFPNVQRVNLSKALNDAIDRDDVQAVRDICSEILVCPRRQTGFVLRAMKRRSISTALVLVELLGNDAEMNHVDSKRRTVLHEAVHIKHDDLFDRILDTKINVEVRDGDGLTPFLRALQKGYHHAIRSLINHAAVNPIPREDAGVYYKYYQGMNHAAAAGVNDILKALFSSFVSICKSRVVGERIISGDLMRIIAKAASNRHESTVKLILELAHALDLESIYQGVIKKELHNGIEAMTKFLMQRYKEAKPKIDKNGKTYGNALANAALKDDSALIIRLLKDGADIDYANGLAYNALGAVASRGNLSMVSLLVEQGADINAKGGHSGNALYLACRGKHIAVVDFLLEKGADVNARLGNDQTALIKASSFGGKSLDALQILIGKAADVNLQNRDGQTALLEASQYGYKDIVEILIQEGADINLQNRDGETALYKASRNGNKEIVEILVLGGADVSLQNISGETALFQASQKGFKDIVKVLVQEGADVSLQNISGETALFQASQKGFKDIVKVLVQEGADVNLQNTSGKTALFVAFELGRREVAQVLIKADVDLEVKGSHQRTALLQAAERGWGEIVHISIEKGADIDSVDADQQTALLIASIKGHVEIFCILLASGAKGFEAALNTSFIYEPANDLQLLLPGAKSDVVTPGGVYDNALSFVCSLGLKEPVEVLLKEGAKFKISADIYDRALELVGSRRHLKHHEHETIANLLREWRAITGLMELRKEDHT